MIEKMRNVENSLIFVNFMTGLTTLILGLALFLILKIDTVNGKLLIANINFSFFEIFIVIAFVFVGFFIYGIRYLFFEWYRVKLYPKIKKRQNKINKKRERKGLPLHPHINKEEGHTPLTWFIKYAFRNGTTVEECIAAKKKASQGDNTIFDWIKTSDAPSFDMWRYANYINNRHLDSNIYRFYYHSEIFQCLDTLFLFMTLVSFVPLIYLISSGKIDNPIRLVCLIGFIVFTFLFHRISKGTGKACIRRFFLEIAVGLTDCNDIHLPTAKSEDKANQ